MEKKIQLLTAVLVLFVAAGMTTAGIPEDNCFQRRLKRGTFWRCCGDDFYHPRKQICCGGNVYDRSAGYRCCGGVSAFHPSTHICCGGSVRRLTPGNTRCCGSRDYNPAKEMCCGGRVVTALGRCCGGKPFIPQTHVCCSGVLSPRPLPASSVRCCGRNAYDSSRNSCCRGAVRPLGYACNWCFGPCCHGKRHRDKICPNP